MSKLVLFTGGARSGKSRLAEQYAERLGPEVIYLATAEERDAEMRERIAQHRRRRPSGWTTIEAPLEAGPALAAVAPGSVVLLDCLSLLVSNLLLTADSGTGPAIGSAIASLIGTARRRDLTLIVVTNEVGMGIVPAYPLGRAYRDLLGRANQQVAAEADDVYLVVCGIAVELRSLEATWLRDS